MHEDVLVVLCTAPTTEVAEGLARGLVEARLAACVNLVPGVRSVYRWKAEVRTEDEVQLIIKTTQHRLGALTQWLEANHPYDVPEMLAMAVARSTSAYARWVREETKP